MRYQIAIIVRTGGQCMGRFASPGESRLGESSDMHESYLDSLRIPKPGLNTNEEAFLKSASKQPQS
jgi:hypothetical protein